MDQEKTTLIVGATGLIGSELLSLLLADDFYAEVKVLVRHHPGIDHPKLKVIIDDFQNLAALGSQLKADHVYCCLGTTMKQAGSKEAFYKVDFHYPLQIAKTAQEQGASQFLLVSALGANIKSKIFYNRVKGEIEVAVSSIPFKGINIFQPSLLLGNRKEKRTGEAIAQGISNVVSFLLVGPLKKYKPIHAKTVAEGMLKIAKQGLNGFYIFESDQIKRI